MKPITTFGDLIKLSVELEIIPQPWQMGFFSCLIQERGSMPIRNMPDLAQLLTIWVPQEAVAAMQVREKGLSFRARVKWGPPNKRFENALNEFIRACQPPIPMLVEFVA